MKEDLRQWIACVPGLRRIVSRLLQLFRSSAQYWESRYRMGGSSGSGSVGRLAQFKAEILNTFVLEHGVGSVIEFGCGDGNQLSLARYPRYVGLDVSKEAISLCCEKFGRDERKSFLLFDPESCLDNQDLLCADLALSLDVIYHLVEEDAYQAYMTCLFRQAKCYVVIYSSNEDNISASAPHIRHRKFTNWTDIAAPEWRLTSQISNRFPFDPNNPQNTSFCDFYIYDRGEAVPGSTPIVPTATA